MGLLFYINSTFFVGRTSFQAELDGPNCAVLSEPDCKGKVPTRNNFG